MKTMVTFKDYFLAYMRNSHKRNGNIYLEYFKSATLKTLTYENITPNNMRKFQSHLLEHISPSATNTYVGILRTATKKYALEYGLKYDVRLDDIKNVKCGKSQSTYLTEDEIKKFASYIPENDYCYYVHRLFFICLMTGCRWSDAQEMTLSKVQGNKFSYVAQKTKSMSSGMYVGENVLQILRDKRFTSMQKKPCSRPTIGKYIKHICEKIGLTDEITLYQAGEYKTKPKWEFITSHVGRRSAATNLYLRDPNALLNISRMLGHSSTSQTERYIKCATEDTDSMRSYKDEFTLSGY